MILVQCEKCDSRFWVHGHCTPNTWTEPGEVVTDLELQDESEELCSCLTNGEAFAVLDEEHPTFDDDVI